MLKKMLQLAANKCGYTIQKSFAHQNSTYSYPFIRSWKNLQGYDIGFWIADQIGDVWYPDDWQNCAEAKELVSLVEPGDRVLEVGCHHGFLTVLLGKAVGEKGYVLGMEAHPQNAMIAHAQVSLNHLGERCSILNQACSDTEGQLSFKNESNAQVLHGIKDNSDGNEIYVKAVTGDSLAEKYGSFNVLKLDVEGFEGKVLAGCQKILASRPKLALELHVPELKKFQTDIESILKAIEIEDYEGTMMLRPDYHTVHPLNLQTIYSSQEIVNLFLKPRFN